MFLMLKFEVSCTPWVTGVTHGVNQQRIYNCSVLLDNLVPRVFLIGKTLVSAGHVTPLQIVVFGGVGEVRIVN